MTLLVGMSQKVTARHVQRQAMLYVRQSTLHQVLENTESTARQYALRERAIALGWSTERVVVIDQDLGQSGASAVDREGGSRDWLQRWDLVMSAWSWAQARFTVSTQFVGLASSVGVVFLDGNPHSG